MRVFKKSLFVILIIVAAAAGGGVVYFNFNKGKAAVGQVKAVYYCPMHPTYTADRPGDCPICNMKLVKREAVSEPSVKGVPQKAEDICYMHNCPMLKAGEKCPMLVVAKAGEAVTCPACGTHVAEAKTGVSEDKILYWTDPMMPGYKSDKPGKSPMGMDLVPVYAGDGAPSVSGAAAPSGYAPILVTPQKLQFIGVRTAKAARRVISKTIRTVGRIAYDPELYEAEQEYISALKASKQAKTSSIPGTAADAERLVESSRTRLRLLGLSRELIEETAAFDAPDKSLLLTDPNGKAWLYAPVYEYELPLVKVGQEVTVEISTVSGKRLAGTIRSVDAVLDPVTRTARVRAALVDPDGILKPEMYVNASIAVSVGEALAIPEEALFDTGTKRIVFVDKGGGLFEPRDVTVGVKAGGFYEVRQGVAEGETVVTSGNFLIDSESRLKAALEGMGGTSGHQHGE